MFPLLSPLLSLLDAACLIKRHTKHYIMTPGLEAHLLADLQ